MEYDKKMKRKSIFFLLYSMNIGGVEKSLLNLLSSIPHDVFDIHVGLIHPGGGFMNSLSPDVKVHVIEGISEHWRELKDPPLKTIRHFFITGRLLKAFAALCIYLTCKIYGGFYWWVDYLLKDVKRLDGLYDVAVAYAGPASDIDYYVVNKIQARKKIGWIHFDIDKVGHDKKMINRLYGFYDRIVVVSDSCRKKFLERFPCYEGKTVTINNIVSPKLIREQAIIGDTFQSESHSKKILTVGRISSEKGQLVALDALELLVQKGYDIVWYFVGDGSDRESCEKKVLAKGLMNHVVFLGSLSNPYGYMRDCDIYVQPSRYEGFCVTILEALCFNSPIVTTNFTSIEEQLEGRENSFIVGMSAEDIALGIEKALLASKTNNVREKENKDIQKFLSIID